MGAVRSYNGTSDRTVMSGGSLGSAITSGFTLIALVNPQSTGGPNPVIALESSTATLAALCFAGSNLQLYSDADDTFAFVGLTTSAWWLIAVSHVSGTNKPRFHAMPLSTGVWTHIDGAGTTANKSGTVSVVRLGSMNLFGGAVIDYGQFYGATAAFIPSALSDAAVQAVGTALTTQSVATAGATNLEDLNQASTGTPVTDLVGTSTQTSQSGTTALTGNDPPGWVYGLSGGAPSVSSTTSVLARASTLYLGRKGGLGALTSSARASTSFTGRRQSTSTVAVSARASTAITGRKTVASTMAVSSRASIAVAGNRSVSSTFNPSVRTSVTATGQKGAAGALNVTARTSVAAAGRKGSSGTLAVSARTSVTFTGSTGAPAVTSTMSVTSRGSTSFTGRKNATGTMTVASRASTLLAGQKTARGTFTVAARASVAFTGTIVFAKSSTMNVTARTAFIAAAGPRGATSTFTPSVHINYTATGRKASTGTLSVASRAAFTAAGRRVATGTFTVRARAAFTVTGMVGSPPDSTYDRVTGSSYGADHGSEYADAVGADPRVSTYGG